MGMERAIVKKPQWAEILIVLQILVLILILLLMQQVHGHKQIVPILS